MAFFTQNFAISNTAIAYQGPPLFKDFPRVSLSLKYGQTDRIFNRSSNSLQYDICINNKSTTLNLCAYFCDLNRCAGSFITNMADRFARTSAGFLADLSLCLRL